MYKPLPHNLTIARSGIHGLGLFATEDILSGHELGITHVADEQFENGYIRTPLGGFFNHSNSPNCETCVEEKYIKLKTIRHIKAGEEITSFYRLYSI